MLLFLACFTDAPDCTRWDERDNLACPCSDATYSMTRYNAANCRPDQTARIEWEPQNGPRVENEDRVGALLFCTCATEGK